MLSRIAEALYWTGRYAERAEDTARLLDVAERAALEGQDLGERKTLAAVLGGPVVAGSRSELLQHYCLDRACPESIATCVRSARENARTIREAVTSEMWQALNTWHLTVAAASPSQLAGAGAHSFLTTIKSRAFQLTGVTESTLPREEGYHWLTLGRHLERLAFTCRVLGTRASVLSLPGAVAPHPEDADADGGWQPWGGATAAQSFSATVLLRSLSASEAYRTTYRSGVEPRRAAEFLLLSPDFPRSALYSACRAEEAVTAVADPGSAARRMSGRLRAELEFRQVEEVLDEGLGSFVGRLAGLAGGVHESLAAGPFARGPVLALVKSGA